MKIGVIGAGYAGLCTAVGFASKGHKVLCVDIDEDKVAAINSGRSPIYEKGLEDMLKAVLKKRLISAQTAPDPECDVFFIAVQTPTNGTQDLSYVTKAAESLAQVIGSSKGYKLVVIKSTVLPGTTESVIPTLEKSGKKAGNDFGIASNPEFLREGTALDDFLKPDRIIIGEYDKKSGDTLEGLYENFNAPIVRTNIRTAEMIKYASNAFLATKVSFINDIGNYCKAIGVDTYDVAHGMGYDKRIGTLFMNPGIGFGGSCLPKDVAALRDAAKKSGTAPHVLEAVIRLNDLQPLRIVEILEKKLKIDGSRICILGLAFKAGTDDIRDAPSLKIIKVLKQNGAKIVVYDPAAMDRMKTVIPDIEYASSAIEALKDSDGCLLLTDWPEFKDLSEKDFGKMKSKIIVEGRKTLDKKRVKNFEGVCW